MIHVVTADNRRIVCEGMKLILESDSGIQVVGGASSLLEASRLCGQFRPDAVLLDAELAVCGDMDGIAVIRAESQQTKVIVLSDGKDEEHVLRAIRGGADGYLLKSINAQELVMTVKSTVLGLSVIHREAFISFSRMIGTSGIALSASRTSLESALTPREIDIVQQVIEGKENREIARSLYISEGTVKNAISAILKKLNLKTRIELVVYAIRNHIVA
ncbi:response regulator [Cohnella suwonensis]|uniref:Response regulator n=1 Tax=Cohnella suwonensis TaxID=696072 RepID=A0ABW0LQK0_9BACL